ncbi:AAA domain-containing protein [Xylaria nigripes]|nr:AAA domain-containing protein [Xylaria nigripes]
MPGLQHESMATPNIYIIGSQCTGKTTLINALSDYFDRSPVTAAKQPAIIKEVARTILKKYDFTRIDIRNSPDRALELQRLIIEAQSAAEKAKLRENSWFISDRSAVDPVVYARKYVGTEAADALRAAPHWVKMRDRMARSLVVVCEAGVGWLTDDGVRLMPLDQAEWLGVHEEFCALLADAGLEYHILPSSVGSREDRLQFVLGLWEEKRSLLALGNGDFEQVNGV